MNILITGAAGGIGSTLSYELNKLGYNIIIIDNLKNGYYENININGETFGKFINMDIRETTQLYNILIENKIESVIHLAAITSLPDCESNKFECISVNVGGTTSVLEACRLAGIKKIIHASTGAIYENNKSTDAPFKESLQTNPLLFYSLSKKMAESVCESYVKNYDMNISIIRLFNVMGHRQDKYRKSPPLINYLVKCFKDGETAMLHSDGNQVRDYIHINDVIDFIIIMLKQNNFSDTYNICTGKVLSVNEIVKYAKEELGENFKYKFRDASKLWENYPSLFEGKYSLKKEIIINEVNKFTLGDNSKAKLLGWIPNDDMKKLVIDIIKKIL